MGIMDDVLEEKRRLREEESTFGRQAAEGFTKSATGGWAGEDAPVELPLSGRIGRYAGEFAGIVPAVEAAGTPGSVFGLSGLGKELAAGFTYGLAEKPEDAQADVYDRMKNGAKQALGFGVGWAALRGAGRLFAGAYGPDELERLLAAGRDLHGPPEPFHGPPEPGQAPEDYFGGTALEGSKEPLLQLEDQRFHMPNEANLKQIEDQRFWMSDKSGEPPDEPPPPGSPPPGSPLESLDPSKLAGPFSTESKFKSMSDRFAQKEMDPEDLARLIEQKRSGVQLSPEDYVAGKFGMPLRGEVPAKIAEPFGRFGLPAITEDQADAIQKSNLYEGHVNSWAQGVLEKIPPEVSYLEQAGRKSVSGDVEEAAKEMTVNSVKHAMDQTPHVSEPLVDAVTPKIENRAALEANVDRLVEKNGLTIDVVQAATKMSEPINYLMSKGMNFNDAAELIDSLAERARMPFDPLKIPEEVSQVPKAASAEVPKWEEARRKMYSPDEIENLFFNVPIKGPRAIELGMIELNPNSGGLHLTEKGYAFLKEYNPEGLSGSTPDYLTGAVRGKGYSNLSLSGPYIEKLFGDEAKNLEESGLVRKVENQTGKGAGTAQYQLEAKGAKQLSEQDPFVKEQIGKFESESESLAGGAESLAGSEIVDKEAIFGDIWKAVEDTGKKC